VEVHFDRESLETGRLLGRGREFRTRGDYDKALEAFDQALSLSQGDENAFLAIVALRRSLGGYVKQNGQWVLRRTQDSADSDQKDYLLKKYFNRFHSWINLPTKYNPDPEMAKDIRQSSFEGRWQASARTVGGEDVWEIRGRVSVMERYRGRPRVGVCVGAVLTNRKNKMVTGDFERIPYMLDGEAKEFVFRLPRDPEEFILKVGVFEEKN
jgi:hypothetical protein